MVAMTQTPLLPALLLAAACLAAAGAEGASGQAAVPAPAPGPAAAATIDVTALGPQPGARVPDFTLPDQAGQPRTLASLAGPNGTMLVFSRSADW